MPATWNLDDIVPSRLWAKSSSQSGNRRKASKIDFFSKDYLFYSCHGFHNYMKFLASVPAAHLLV